MPETPHHRPGLFVLAAPSGGGKSSLIRALIEKDSRLKPSVSHTTRAPRPGETDGEHYYFVSDAEFQRLIESDAFLEYALVFGQYKGTGRKAVEDMMEEGFDVLLDIDWQGARQVRETFPACRTIFILPPSMSALADRLHHRGQDSEQVIEERMRRARDEISHWDEFDFVVVNDDFETALEDIQSIIERDRQIQPVPDAQLRSLLDELLKPD